jgi:hypothetical protein
LYLFCHELRVSPDEKSLNAELLGWMKPGDQPLVFCNIVGSRKLNFNCILQHITFGWDEHDTSSCPFQGVRPIEIHYPMIGQITDTSYIRINLFNNKICERLRLDRPPGDEFNIILVDFHGPLCDSSRGFFTLEDVSQWVIRYKPNCVHQKVMLQLPRRHEYCVE